MQPVEEQVKKTGVVAVPVCMVHAEDSSDELDDQTGIISTTTAVLVEEM